MSEVMSKSNNESNNCYFEQLKKVMEWVLSPDDWELNWSWRFYEMSFVLSHIFWKNNSVLLIIPSESDTINYDVYSQNSWDTEKYKDGLELFSENVWISNIKDILVWEMTKWLRSAIFIFPKEWGELVDIYTNKFDENNKWCVQDSASQDLAEILWR